jgi:multidrug efflux pump
VILHGNRHEIAQQIEGFQFFTVEEGIGFAPLTFLTGFSFLGQGQNTAQAFITLKDWSQRGEAESAERIVADINRTFAPLRDGKISALQPPPIDNLGNSSGFSFRLQDRGQRGYAALMRASDQLLAAAAASPVLKDVYVEGLSPAPQIVFRELLPARK